MSELLRPNSEELSYEERLAAINRYLGETAVALNHASTEYNWAITQRIQLRTEQRADNG